MQDDEPVHDLDDGLSLDTLVSMNRQTFSGALIHYPAIGFSLNSDQRPKAPAVKELIGNEIHPPGVIGVFSLRAMYPVSRHPQPVVSNCSVSAS